jgi:outer membrane protein TolC
MVPLFALGFGLAAQNAGPGAARLSLQDAIRTSLQNNLQVSLAQETRNQTVAGILTSEGAFDWNLSGGLMVNRTDLASATPVYTVAPSVPFAGTFFTRGGPGQGPELDLAKAFTWGGSLDVNYNATYQAYRASVTDAAGNPIPGTAFNNPVPYNATLSATYAQNLLQGFGREMATASLVIACKNGQAADYTFQQTIINLVSTTEGYYWNLVYAQRWLDTKKLALELAQKHLDENRFRLKTGTIARLDVTGAEAQVAQAEQDIITAQAQLDNARDTLIRALYPNAERPAALEASDAPDLTHIQLNEDAAVKMALDERVELKAARIAKDVAQLQSRVAEDKVRPQLTASAGYVGSSNTYTALGPVDTDLAGAKFPGYTLGAKFAVPLQNRAAKGNQAQAQAAFRSSTLSLRDQELSIVLQVRTAFRNIQAAEKGVKAAEKTVYLQKKTLDAEQFKFSRGVSTSFIVLQDMTNLDNARSAEIQAQINYANAVTGLEQAVGHLLQARHLEIR